MTKDILEIIRDFQKELLRWHNIRIERIDFIGKPPLFPAIRAYTLSSFDGPTESAVNREEIKKISMLRGEVKINTDFGEVVCNFKDEGEL